MTNIDGNVGPVWVVHQLGSSYSQSEVPRDVERYDTLDKAIGAADDRHNVGHWQPQDFAYANREPDRALTPNVDGDLLDVYLADPSDEMDYVPDARYERDESGELRPLNY